MPPPLNSSSATEPFLRSSESATLTVTAEPSVCSPKLGRLCAVYLITKKEPRSAGSESARRLASGKSSHTSGISRSLNARHTRYRERAGSAQTRTSSVQQPRPRGAHPPIVFAASSAAVRSSFASVREKTAVV